MYCLLSTIKFPKGEKECMLVLRISVVGNFPCLLYVRYEVRPTLASSFLDRIELLQNSPSNTTN